MSLLPTEPPPEAEKLTLDTNVIQEYWRNREKREAVETLLDLAERGLVELAVTCYIRADILFDPLASRIDDLATELAITELEQAEQGADSEVGEGEEHGPDPPNPRSERSRPPLREAGRSNGTLQALCPLS